MPPVNASSNDAPRAGAQATWQRGQSSPNGAAPGDSASQPFTVTGQQSAKPASPAGAGTPAGAPRSSGGTFPRFEPQTLQALLALQTIAN